VLKKTGNNRINKALISCFAAAKKAAMTGLVMIIAIFSLLPLTASAAADKLEISIKVYREIVQMPDLYERLTLKLQSAYNAQGTGAVTVLETKMNLLGTDAIPLGEYDLGKDIWFFFEIKFDGPESTNEYMRSRVVTSYEFFSKSEQKLTVFKIMGRQGDAFEDMVNLNPGDIKTGVVHIDPLSVKPTEPTTQPTTQPTAETTTKTATETTKTASLTTAQTTTGQLPITDDQTPVKPLIYLSVGLALLLGLQFIILIISKHKDKASKTEKQA